MSAIEGTQSYLGRCVSAEVRARLAAMRISGVSLAKRMGRSQNYIAKRLRDEAPFTLDDVEDIVEALEMDTTNTYEFIAQAVDRNGDDVLNWMFDQERPSAPLRAVQFDDDVFTEEELRQAAAHRNPDRRREAEGREESI